VFVTFDLIVYFVVLLILFSCVFVTFDLIVVSLPPIIVYSKSLRTYHRFCYRFQLILNNLFCLITRLHSSSIYYPIYCIFELNVALVMA